MSATATAEASLSVIALVGTPNCGKTTLFNALTGLRQKVANYPGVTVEKKEGFLGRDESGPILLDLPGLYSLQTQTEDERVTREVLLGDIKEAKPSALLVILDGSALERSLALSSTLFSLGLPMAAALTMFDEIKARGGNLDVDALAKRLGIPVVPIVGHRGVGIDDLRQLALGHRDWPQPRALSLNGAASRFAWAREVLSGCLRAPLGEDALSQRIDNVVLHPVAGPLIFFGVMAFFFQSIFTWAKPAMDALSWICGVAGDRAGAFLPDGLLRHLVVFGLFKGVGSVVAFLPQILILFFLLFLLEDIGYMARAAFLMDRIMGWAGLQGRSFISLISSYACAVPGIMATRAIPAEKDRLATMLSAPFMTCSARLPVYALLIGAFIPDRPVLGPLRLQGLVLLGLYFVGSVSALLAAWVMRSTMLRGDITPFYMELPPYRFPAIKSVLLAMLDRARIFLRRAGTIILAASMVICLLLSFPSSPKDPALSPAQNDSRQMEVSLAGRAGKLVEPVFRPIGFDWRINVGLLGSLVAREIVVSTLAQVYAVDATGGDDSLQRALRTGMSLPTALSLLAFFIYALQCFSTLAVLRRETNGWSWPAFAFAYMFACAWGASFVVFHLARAAGL